MRPKAEALHPPSYTHNADVAGIRIDITKVINSTNVNGYAMTMDFANVRSRQSDAALYSVDASEYAAAHKVRVCGFGFRVSFFGFRG